MTTVKLFVSFWNICLDNLPEGNFRRRSLHPDDAKRCIERGLDDLTVLAWATTNDRVALTRDLSTMIPAMPGAGEAV